MDRTANLICEMLKKFVEIVNLRLNFELVPTKIVKSKLQKIWLLFDTS